MTLPDVFERVRDRHRTLVVFAPVETPDVAGHFATRNAAVERRRLPPNGPEGFVVVRDDGEFVGACPLSSLRSLLDPPLHRPRDRETVAEPWRSLYEVLDETLFAAFDRRQLLAATREIEDRARRVGEGRLRVGFQSRTALEAQASVYRRLATETDLDVHAYVADDGEAPTVPGVTVHVTDDPEIARHWTLAYDGPEGRQSALVAAERDSGSYDGFWTNDPDLVAAISESLAGVDDSGEVTRA